jgi:hypothetical protein
MMECGWKDLANEAPASLKFLQSQLKAVYTVEK